MGLLLAHGALLAWLGVRNTPNSNEASHLAAGVWMWHFGDFSMYPVNPPLVRMIAAAPVARAHLETDWSDYPKRQIETTASRPEWSVGIAFVRKNVDRARQYFAWARWMIIPLSLMGGYICWRWAGELYGPSAGAVALLLWCFSPNVLAWSATLCPDAAAGALGAAAGYFFWRWLKKPDGLNAVGTGVVLGIAQLTKMTWIVLFPLWPIIWGAWLWAKRYELRRSVVRSQALQLVGILLTGVLVLNLGYGFEGSFRRFGQFTFLSRALAAEDSRVDGGPGGNRFSQGWLAAVPVPLPENYLRGVDLQKVDFEKGSPSYLLGQWKHCGWWYYYVVCAALKVPLGVWILGLVAIVASLGGSRRVFATRTEKVRGASRAEPSRIHPSWMDELVLLLPAVVVLVLVSSQTGFSHHFRYALPAFPLFFIWISKVVCAAQRRPRIIAMPVIGALAWSIASSLWIYPHSMSYFNEISGGPLGGHKYLLHANVDWGQDVQFLKEWWERHLEVKPLYSLCRNSFGDDLLIAGDNRSLGKSLRILRHDGVGEEDDEEDFVPKPGWYAASVHRIHDPHDRYRSFCRFTAVATAGYSINIYHIKLQETNRVRRELGLPEFSSDWEEERNNGLVQLMAKAASSSHQCPSIVRAAIVDVEQQGSDTADDLLEILQRESSCRGELVSPADIQSNILNRFDVLVFRGGKGSEQAAALGTKGKKAVREFVRSGGGYVGICGGAFLATANYDWSLGLVNAKTQTGKVNIPGVGIASMSARGVGTVKMELTDAGTEVLGPCQGMLDVRYSGGPILSPAGRRGLPRYTTLARFRTEVWEHERQQGTTIDTAAIIAASFGKGLVIAISPHPEMTDGLESLVTRLILSTARKSAGIH